MATPFSEIYILFLSKNTDEDLANMPQLTLERSMEDWLISAVGRFTTIGNRKRVKSFNKDEQQFDEDLNHTEQEILAIMMLVEYLKTQTISGENLKLELGSKDYAQWSPSKRIEVQLKLKDSLENDITKLLSQLSYSLDNFKEVNKNDK